MVHTFVLGQVLGPGSRRGPCLAHVGRTPAVLSTLGESELSPTSHHDSVPVAPQSARGSTS
eukprot:4534579-Prymnesium_polylepis.1